MGCPELRNETIMNLVDLFTTLGINLLIQAVFFGFAALKTDKVTDLS